MASINASVAGVPQVIADLILKMAAFEAAALAKTQVSAARIYNASQNDCPVDTGDMKDSGRIQEYSKGSEKGFKVSYGVGLRKTSKVYSYPQNQAQVYPWFVELGTVNMAARPFLMPAFDTEIPNWLTELDGL